MATALSAPRDARALRSPLEQSEAARAAEAHWRAVVDAQAADLALLRERWPDRQSPECVAAIARLRRRAVPGGDADEAMAGVHAAYGGNVPARVHRRLEGYVSTRLTGAPLPATPPAWPARDLAEHTDEPAIVRKARRQRRRQQVDG